MKRKLLSLMLLPAICHSAIICYVYDHKKPHTTNKTIRCPDPADTCFTERSRKDGELISRSCVWAGHCTERKICGRQSKQCNLHCCHRPRCNNSEKTKINQSFTFMITFVTYFWCFLHF